MTGMLKCCCAAAGRHDGTTRRWTKAGQLHAELPNCPRVIDIAILDLG